MAIGSGRWKLATVTTTFRFGCACVAKTLQKRKMATPKDHHFCFATKRLIGSGGRGLFHHVEHVENVADFVRRQRDPGTIPAMCINV